MPQRRQTNISKATLWHLQELDMPNWCTNYLDVTGPDADLQRFKMKVNTNESCFDFNSFVEYPAIYADADARFAEYMELPIEERRALSTPEDGFNRGGYQWCVDNWGTKWPAQMAVLEEHGGTLSYWFETAHTPPIPLLIAASKEFPSLEFQLDCDLEIGYHAVFVIHAGELTYESWETEEEYDLIEKGPATDTDT